MMSADISDEPTSKGQVLTEDARASILDVPKVNDIEAAMEAHARFERTRNIAHLDTAINLFQKALDVASAPDAGMLSWLGKCLTARFEIRGKLDDLERAITSHQCALNLMSDKRPAEALWLQNLACSLHLRFRRLGELNDLEKVIAMQSRAVELTPDDDPGKAYHLDNLSLSQKHRFMRFGDLCDLENAVKTQQWAVELSPDGHSDMARRLCCLGSLLRHRFARLGGLDDLEHAIAGQRRAVELTSDGHHDKPLWLNNLAYSLRTRFQHLGDIDSLESAIMMQNRSVELTPDGHPSMPIRLDNLGFLHLLRFNRLGDLDDLGLSIVGRQRAVELTPDGHPDMPIRLNNLGSALCARFQRLGNSGDLECAITAQRRAVELTPPSQPDKPIRLRNLARSLVAHFRVERTGDYLNEAVTCLMAAIDQPLGTPSIRLDAAQFAIEILNEHSHLSMPETLLLLHSRIIDMLPEIVWLGHSLSRRLQESRHIRGLTNSAVRIAIGVDALVQAVEWLDAGRSFVWSQVLSLRSPVDELIKHHPDLAHDLERIHTQLQGSVHTSLPESTSTTSSQDLNTITTSAEGDRHRGLAIEYGGLIADVRRQSGFEDFMKPKKLTASLPSSASLSGPIVFINVEQISCDALVLTPGRTIFAVALPDLSSDKAESLRMQWQSYLMQHNVRERGMSARRYHHPDCPPITHVLGCIWRWIVHPVLQALGVNEPKTYHDPLPHVTWCPAGPLSQLPLHAAGIYDRESGPRVYDFVISSYTPSLSTLTRSVDAVAKQRRINPSVLAVTQPSTPGFAPLPGTMVEEEHLRQVLSQSHIAHCVLSGQQASIVTVRAVLDDYPWLHLACHGYQDLVDATKSAFALYDGPLSLIDLMGMKADNAELAFLSACQTAVGDEKIPEESMHLAAGMLAVGFKGVVATMWSIRDDDAPGVVEAYYEKLLELRASGNLGKGETGAAHALHEATKRLREEVGEKEFVRWAPFVHFGV